ncbi:hypothetical protein CYMTET_28942 [Cymbomonas tetramitiformis]|uniref:Uncharacterized protein n=1 Tax=Cymbomonas tetramitiformis TaxID=36881 RepID=A0AAE0KVF9_9CHLO|nr:hypothetical protein CYMTET_28942 [Cymbomonas tetramitiformis]
MRAGKISSMRACAPPALPAATPVGRLVRAIPELPAEAAGELNTPAAPRVVHNVTRDGVLVHLLISNHRDSGWVACTEAFPRATPHPPSTQEDR